MSGFSPEWLALREPVDHRSRDAGVAEQLRAQFTDRDSIRVVDLGCGTGSNLRGTFHLLPDEQHWTLVDYDQQLLSAARQSISDWADRHEAGKDELTVYKDGKVLRIGFRSVDLNADLDRALGTTTDLITASAFFDLCSTTFIERFSAAVARLKAVFFTVLTYNGEQQWSPSHPADAKMLAAFCAHQTSDKGFGPSAGPSAAAALRTSFEAAGYDVTEGDSPWIIDASDRQLIADLATGFAGAVTETGAVDASRIASWSAVARDGAVVGHTDTLALPPR
ncbi:MAG: class I SAM-dependent methyltransferase [Hyphomicrobiaceae bacterium]